MRMKLHALLVAALIVITSAFLPSHTEAITGPSGYGCSGSVNSTSTLVSVRTWCGKVEPYYKWRSRIKAVRKSDGSTVYLYGQWKTMNCPYGGSCESRANMYWTYYIYVSASYQVVYA